MEAWRNGEHIFSANQIDSAELIKKQFTDSIGAWKIVCTYMIVILHYGGAVGWKLAVEFFFIVAGLLMAYEYDIKNTEYLQYISKRILRLWPHYIFSFVVFIVVSMIMDGGGGKIFTIIFGAAIFNS